VRLLRRRPAGAGLPGALAGDLELDADFHCRIAKSLGIVGISPAYADRDMIGMSFGFLTAMRAPLGEMSRTVQSRSRPTASNRAKMCTGRRGWFRRSSARTFC